MVEWLIIAAGGDADDVEEPRIVGEDDEDGEDAPFVFAAPSALQQILSDAEPSRLAEIGELWAQELADEGNGMDTELAQDILTQVARLARIAQSSGHIVYCWIG